MDFRLRHAIDHPANCAEKMGMRLTVSPPIPNHSIVGCDPVYHLFLFKQFERPEERHPVGFVPHPVRNFFGCKRCVVRLKNLRYA